MDEDALVCDLAEAYHIYDYRSLPARRVATFAVGLRENSRVKMALAGLSAPIGEQLQALAIDYLAAIYAALTGSKPPASIHKVLIGAETGKKSDVVAFATPAAFERRRLELLGGVQPCRDTDTH